MNNILSYASMLTNYGVINNANLYNFMYISMKNLTEEERYKYVDNMLLILGNTFKSSFKYYIYNKFPDSDILKYL